MTRWTSCLLGVVHSGAAASPAGLALVRPFLTGRLGFLSYVFTSEPHSQSRTGLVCPSRDYTLSHVFEIIALRFTNTEFRRQATPAPVFFFSKTDVWKEERCLRSFQASWFILGPGCIMMKPTILYCFKIKKYSPTCMRCYESAS